MNQRLDLAYTWVDDTFPGYRDALLSYAKSAHDRNPNRTRDNLQLLRFSLRSVERYAPWVNRIYLLTCRPQVPAWIDRDHPRLVIVHHDEIMASQYLPTFNSFAIVSHVHLLPGISRRFLYLEDDMLFLNRVAPTDFMTEDGRIRVFRRRRKTPRIESLDPVKSSPWNLALARVNELLDARYGPKPRYDVNHSPLLIDRDDWTDMLEMWSQEVERTRQSRFRAAGNIAPEYLYPHAMVELGRGVFAPISGLLSEMAYAGLENFYPLTFYQLLRLGLSRPKACTLNDNFDQFPNPSVERMVRRTLLKWFPTRSSFERHDAD